MVRALYNWIMRLAAGRFAPFVLCVEAFCEAIFLPLPPDVILAPMILQRRERAWTYCVLVTLSSLAGGAVSWAIGYFLSGVGQQILTITGHGADWPAYQCWFQKNGPWVILLKGATPIPFALVTIASGLAHLTFWKFILACLVARVVRFVFTTWLVLRFGPAMQAQVEKNLVLWGSAIVVVIVGVYAALHFAHLGGVDGGACAR